VECEHAIEPPLGVEDVHACGQTAAEVEDLDLGCDDAPRSDLEMVIEGTSLPSTKSLNVGVGLRQLPSRAASAACGCNPHPWLTKKGVLDG